MFDRLFTAAAQKADASDEYITNTELLLKGEGTNGQDNNTFVDSSASNHSITRYNDATQGSFSPFSPKGWSGYFDGNGDYLRCDTALDDFTNTSDNFTIEAWFNSEVSPSTFKAIFGVNYNQGQENNLVVGVRNVSGTPKISFHKHLTTGSTTTDENYGSFTLNTWNHIAATYDGSSIKLYLNGTQIHSVSGAFTRTLSTCSFCIGGELDSASAIPGNYFDGYISNVRVVKDVLYTTTFIPPTGPLTAVTNTKFLSLQDNRFIDNSASNHSITVNGGAAIKPTSPFSGDELSSSAGSVYFDGSGDYLAADPTGALFDFPTGGFNTTSLTGFTHGNGSNSSSSNAGPVSGYYRLCSNNSYSGGYVVDNTARQYDRDFSLTCKMAPQGNYFPDGFCMCLNDNTSTRGTRGAMVPPTGGGRKIGFSLINWFGPQPPYQTLWFTEVTSGTETTLATADSGQGSYAGAGTAGFFGGTQYWWWDYEHSTGTHKVYHSTSSTKPSTPRVTATYTMPSTPLHAYIGGGTGGASTEWRLLEWGAKAPTTTAQDFAFSSGDFTYEAWIYPTSFSGGSKRIFYPDANADALTMGGDTTSYGAGTLSYWSGTNTLTSATGAVKVNQWTHVAVTRVGGFVRIFVNGVQSSGATIWQANNTADTIMRIGGNPSDSTYFTGYISDARVVKGTALYTSNFTPPTAPLQTTTNTKLLLHGDNGGVKDSLGKANCETNGNIAIDTSVKKFGVGSFEGGNSNGDYLLFPDDPKWDLSGGIFTVEGWVYPKSNSSNIGIVLYSGTQCGWSASNAMSYNFFIESNGTLKFNAHTGSSTYSGLSSSSNDITYNAWNYVAVVGNGSNYSLFINGSRVDTDTTTKPNPPSGMVGLSVGGFGKASGCSPTGNAYYDDLRITKGVARYDPTQANHIVPTKTHPTI